MEPTFTSLLPPILAIVLAVATRRVLLPLTAGVALGCLLVVEEGEPWYQALITFYETITWTITDGSHLRVLQFSLLLGAMVGVLEIGGAMASFIAGVAKRIKGRRGAQSLVALSGLAIFFDDYANTLLVGGTMRSTTDRFKVSRSKLAYLVDSTAAPVAGLSLISTWAVTEIMYMEDGLKDAGVEGASAGFQLFLESIPYRFYPWLALVMVFLIALTGRDYGPMKAEEEKAVGGRADQDEPADQDGGKQEFESTTASADDSQSTSELRRCLGEIYAAVVQTERPQQLIAHQGTGVAWVPTLIPVIVCILTVIGVMVYTGYQQVGPQSEEMSMLRYIGALLDECDSYLALVIGGGAGWLVALGAHLSAWSCPAKRLLFGSLRGAAQMLPAMAILWLAWSLSHLTEKEFLNTGGDLASLLNESLNATLLPSVVFVVAGLVAFSTGTSWGTMAILTPLSVSLAIQMQQVAGAGLDPSGAICVATAGSVLAGAIFGDHCSPISDTTVLSSRASGCDHVAHVRTQAPYALTVAAISIVLGTVPAAFGVSPWLLLLLGSVALWAVVRFIGRTTDRPAPRKQVSPGKQVSPKQEGRESTGRPQRVR